MPSDKNFINPHSHETPTISIRAHRDPRGRKANDQTNRTNGSIAAHSPPPLHITLAKSVRARAAYKRAITGSSSEIFERARSSTARLLYIVYVTRAPAPAGMTRERIQSSRVRVARALVDDEPIFGGAHFID